MRKKDLISSIADRIPFRVAQRMLRAAGFPSAMTWTKIREKITAHAGATKLDFGKLQDSYLQSLVASEKSVRAYPVLAAGKAELLSAISSLELDQDHLFVKKYPYVLSADALSKATNNGTVFVGKEILHNGTALLFSTIRIDENKELLAADKIPVSIRKRYTEFWGIKRTYHQSYDAVYVPHDGNYVWVCADYPKSANSDYAEFAQISVRNCFNELVGGAVLSAPVNIFSAIDSIYKDSSEGTIISLSHVVSTASRKDEKMRDGLCLREELFHKAGAGAVGGNLSAFAIGVAWSDAPGAEGDVELHISGEPKDANRAAPVVTDAIVRKCSTPEEFDFVLDKITSHVATD